MAKPPPAMAYVPPGHDPTDYEYPPRRTTVTGCGGRVLSWSVWILAFVGLVALYQGSQRPRAAPSPTPEIIAPEIVIVTATFSATFTPGPSPTPGPTNTASPIPNGALATWTPGAWMLTRFAATYDSRFASPTETKAP
jgi:hypothetical protein